jgi:hypothetical protein
VCWIFADYLRFEFQKSRQLFVRTRNETLSIVAMCVCNPERLAFVIYRRDTAPTSTGFAEIQAIDGWPINPHRT